MMSGAPMTAHTLNCVRACCSVWPPTSTSGPMSRSAPPSRAAPLREGGARSVTSSRMAGHRYARVHRAPWRLPAAPSRTRVVEAVGPSVLRDRRNDVHAVGQRAPPGPVARDAPLVAQRVPHWRVPALPPAQAEVDLAACRQGQGCSSSSSRQAWRWVVASAASPICGLRPRCQRNHHHDRNDVATARTLRTSGVEGVPEERILGKRGVMVLAAAARVNL